MLKTLVLRIAILLIACQATVADAAPDKVRLQLKWFHQFQFAGYYMALEKGFYREAGLDVEILEGGSYEQHYVDNMLEGKTDFVIGSSDIILDRVAGKPVVALAAIMQASPGVLLVRADSGIHTPLDLAGKRLMLSESAEILAMLSHEGIDIKKLNAVPKNIEVNLDDLVDGKVDAYFGYITNEAYLLKKRGVTG
jgi:ABC-type nitrate/sulfonate/bicarbonate transport system substrate-binding protein